MRYKPDFIENPLDGSPLFREPLKISGVVFIFLALFLIQYKRDTTDNKYVRDNQWKFGEGCWIGDWLSFENTMYKVRNHTLFKQDTGVAVIINIDKNFFADNELIVKSIKTGKTGTYHQK